MPVSAAVFIMEIQGGPERLRFVSKHHQTQKALDMCMVLISTLPPAFQRRKAAPTHPSRGKSHAEDLQGAQHDSAAHKGSGSQAEQGWPREQGSRPCVIQKRSQETSSAPSAPPSGPAWSWKCSSSDLPTAQSTAGGPSTLCLAANLRELHLLRAPRQTLQARLKAKSCTMGGRKGKTQAGVCSEAEKGSKEPMIGHC